MKKTILVSVLLCAGSQIAFGWGQKGHDVTAALAEKHLTPTTLAAVEELFDGHSPVYYANWLDNASHTPEYAYSKTWHYKNIDAGIAYEQAPLLETGNIITALNEQTAVLRNPEATKEQKALALKIVVHLLGDLHQPMHMGHASDLGGNRWFVKFFNNNTNLHSVWDSSLPEAAHKWSYTEWVDQIDRTDDTQKEIILSGGFDDWGKETSAVCALVYNGTPEETKISYDYIAEWAPVIEQQFLKGGLRLADLLNSIFDHEYQPQSEAAKTR